MTRCLVPHGGVCEVLQAMQLRSDVCKVIYKGNVEVEMRLRTRNALSYKSPKRMETVRVLTGRRNTVALLHITLYSRSIWPRRIAGRGLNRCKLSVRQCRGTLWWVSLA